MGLIPPGESGKILQWYDAGGGVLALRNASMSDVMDRLVSTVAIPGERYFIDSIDAAVAAMAQPLVGTGSLGAVALSGGALFSAPAISGSGSLGAVAVTGGTPSTFGAPAVSGTGSLGPVVLTPTVKMNAAAVSGTGTLGPVSLIAADSTAPTITAFTLGTPSGLTVPVTLTATDAVGVVEYVVNTTSGNPTPGTPNSAPTSWTAGGAGTYTLYAHVRDAANNWTTASAGPVTVLAGLIPHNADLATTPRAIDVSDYLTYNQEFDVWVEGDAACTAGRVAAPAELSGPTYAVKLYVPAVYEGSDASLGYTFLAADFAGTSGVVTWDDSVSSTTFRYVTLFVRAVDSGGAIINNTTTLANAINLYKTIGGSSDVTTLYKAAGSFAASTKYTRSFDLKAWVIAHLNGGKTWADVSRVELHWFNYTDSAAALNYHINGWR